MFSIFKNKLKKVSKWKSLCCTNDYNWVTVMHGAGHGFKFEFNDNIQNQI